MEEQKRPLLSVAIITKNEEDRLPLLLEALDGWADEVVVLDSGSQDRTVEIARSFGAKVFVEPWRGFGPQKNSALEKTSGKWVLFLDADEVPDEGLKRAIKEAIRNGPAAGYEIRRRAVYLGKPLKRLWANEWLLRLVRRDANPRWVGNIHEKLIVEGKVERIPRGVLYHYTYRNLKEHLEKSFRYGVLSAEEYHRKGKRFSLLKLLLSPTWSFFKVYFLKGGFLEGIRGLFIALSYWLNGFVKYALLWELDRNSRGGKGKDRTSKSTSL